MLDSQMMGDECILRAHVIVESAFWEPAWSPLIRRRGRLAVSEKRWDDDEVFLRVEGLVFAD